MDFSTQVQRELLLFGQVLIRSWVEDGELKQEVVLDPSNDGTDRPSKPHSDRMAVGD